MICAGISRLCNLWTEGIFTKYYKTDLPYLLNLYWGVYYPNMPPDVVNSLLQSLPGRTYFYIYYAMIMLDYLDTRITSRTVGVNMVRDVQLFDWNMNRLPEINFTDTLEYDENFFLCHRLALSVENLKVNVALYTLSVCVPFFTDI